MRFSSFFLALLRRPARLSRPAARFASFLVVLAALSAHLGAALHELAVPHRICAAHGERAHLLPRSGDAASGADVVFARAKDGAGLLPDASQSLDDHCGICGLTGRTVGHARAAGSRASVAPPRPALRDQTALLSEKVALLASAPKTSPPLSRWLAS